MVNGVNGFGVDQEEDFLSLANRPVSLDVGGVIDPLSGTGPEERGSRVRDFALSFARPGTLFNVLSRGFGEGTEEIAQRKRRRLADRLAEAEGEARIRTLSAPPAPIERFETVFNDQGQPVGQKSSLTGKVIESPRAKARQEADKLRLEELKIKPTKGSRILTPEQTAAAGFIGDTVVEEASDGSKKVLQKPKATDNFAQKKAARKRTSDFNKLESEVAGSLGLIDALIGRPQVGIEGQEGFKPAIPEHPGLRAAVGIFDQSFLSPTVIGDTRDFELRNKQLTAQTFLAGFQKLKGGGTVTEAEGKKAQDAIARLELAQNEDTYITAVNELRAVLSESLTRARSEIGLPIVTSQADFDALKPGDEFVEDGQVFIKPQVRQ